MISNIQLVEYQGKPLANYNFYLMGQICIHKDYRGKGIFDLLYQHHKLIYSRGYELLVTEISANNKRSLRAHEKLGFKTTYTYTDNMDEWKVVVWDWI
jgi:L-amino acid N-acyltransferase YncA